MIKLFPCREGNLWLSTANNNEGIEITKISSYGDRWFNDLEFLMDRYIEEDVDLLIARVADW